MSRPYYCKSSDNLREGIVINALLARLNVDAAKLRTGKTYTAKHTGAQRHQPYDGELYCNGQLIGLIEIKCRTGCGSRFDDWHMSLMKIKGNLAAAAAKHVPLFLVYRWDDGIFFADATTFPLDRTHIGGRWDRNDAHDEEEMLLMKRQWFRPV